MPPLWTRAVHAPWRASGLKDLWTIAEAMFLLTSERATRAEDMVVVRSEGGCGSKAVGRTDSFGRMP